MGILMSVKHANIDVRNDQTIQIGHDLYAFSWQPFTACYYEKIVFATNELAPSKKVLAKAGHSRRYFAITAVVGDAIYITGGVVNNMPTDTCLTLDLNTHELQTTIPIMNEPRRSHSSATLGLSVYVFGG